MMVMRNRNNPVRVTEEEAVRQRSAQWRQQHPERPALPAALWSAATELARRQGVSRTRGAWLSTITACSNGSLCRFCLHCIFHIIL